LRALPSLLAQIKQEKARREAEATRQNAAAIRARCRTLAGFIREAWHVLEPVQRYVHNWHIDAVCDHLEAVTSGRINRLLVNVPPGSMKSLIVSVFWQAWEWGPCGRRSLRTITTSFNDGPVTRDTRKTRDLILSDWYQALWPEVQLVRTGETSFANSDTGYREGVAFGSLTSQRGDRLVIDDPHSTKTAESDDVRNATTRQFREGAQNRLNDQEASAIVVIMQRLHDQDISGVIKSLGMDYVHLMLPMEFEVERACETALGFRDPRTQDGELLDPVRFPPAVVDKLKRDMGSYAYAGQYQQRPTPRDGGMFQRGWFEIVDAAPVEATRVRAWDFAATKPKPGTKPDWTVGIRVARDRSGIFYVEKEERLQQTAAMVRQTVKTTAEADGTRVRIRIPEDPGQAGKDQAASYLTLLAGWIVKAVRPTGEKALRAAPAAAQAEAGNIKLVRGAWNEGFLEEVCAFPGGAPHDDRVDAFADAVNELALGGGKTGLIDFYREQVMDAAAAENAQRDQNG
jgi:predicted phage terminase large subunit-like protein